MKKFTKIISICCLGFLLAACGTQENTKSESETNQTETNQAETVQSENRVVETELQTPESGQDSQNSQGTAQNGTTQPETIKQPESVPEADQAPEETQEQDLVPAADWNGTFSKGDEQVVLAAADSTSFEFRFSVSGIAGVARTDGNSSTGTFTGDDNNVISFSISGSTLSVSVSHPDVEGESASTISGTYELVQ